MRIISWNVNGLRANIKNKGVEWVITQKPEIICLQEIKVHPTQMSQEVKQIFADYHVYWNPALRPGYSGVATFTRIKPKDTHIEIGDSAFDAEGRLIVSKFQDFALLNVYAPNGRRDHSRVKFKLDFYGRLLDLCDKLHREGVNLILCGDINTAHKDIDLRNPKSNKNTSGFLPEERDCIDQFLDHGFVDVFRRMYPNVKKYTWWTYRYNARSRNIGWRLDYFLISEPLTSRVRNIIINDDIEGSDHCPITLIVDI